MMRRAINRPGLTLLELMIGLVVTGMLTAMGYAAFAATIDRRDDAARAAESVARATGVRHTLLQWFDGATPRIADGIADPSIAYQVNVLTQAETPLRAARTDVRLLVDDGRLGMGTGLIAVLKPDMGVDSMIVVLDPLATGMAVQYLAEIDGLLQWLPLESIPTSTMPVALRIQINTDDPDMAAGLAYPIEVPLAMRTAR